MYALIKNGAVAEYPLSIPAWRVANPQVSLPAEPSEQQLNEQSIFNVIEEPQPQTTYDQVAEDGGVIFQDGAWTHVWVVKAATPAQEQANKTAIYDSIVADTQERMDRFAQTRGYDNMLSACTYATSPTGKFQIEGQYCVNSRDATWASLIQIMDEVQAGTRTMPNGYADIEPDLPLLAWPIATN
jgi:hypothetical protein